MTAYSSTGNHAENFRSSEEGSAIMRLESRRMFDWIIKVGVFLCFVLGFWYILLVNSLATRGFELEEERTRRTAIIKEFQAWEIQVTIPNSLYALESSEQVQEMQITKSQEFIKIRDGQVAFHQ